MANKTAQIGIVIFITVLLLIAGISIIISGNMSTGEVLDNTPVISGNMNAGEILNDTPDIYAYTCGE